MARPCCGLGGDGRSGRVRSQRQQQLLLVRPSEIEVPLGEEAPDERKAVGVESARGQADDRVAGPGGGPVDQPVPLDDADAAAGEVERRRVHEPGVLRGLPADERTARLAAAGRDAADELRGLRRIEPPDGDVIEEEQRLGAAADDVVGAHRDEVDPDRVVATERGRDRGLGPDAVGRGDEHRLAVARRDRDRPAEPAEPAEHLRPPRALDGRPHELDGPVAGIDVDAGGDVRGARGAQPRTGSGSSRMNLRDAASYGTGSG